MQSLKAAGLQVLPTATGTTSFDLARQATESTPAPKSVRETAAAAVNAADTQPAGRVQPVDAGASLTVKEGKTPPADIGPQLTEYQSESLPLDSRSQKLEILSQTVAACTRCSELVACRNNTVFGVGNQQPELCFVGEGPGADEDRQGEPFVGAAGQLLNKIIAACKLSREEVYILNTVKCRPPGNRNPNETELENCWPYAVEQLEILQPKFICCLGSVAARTLLQTKKSIGVLRGQFLQYRGSQVIVTYHPAYLLGNSSAKRRVWDDMKLLMAAMGREI